MKLVKNYLYNASYQVFILLVPLVTTPYIARVFGPYGVGINAYTNSVIQYFILFGSIGINLYGNREIAYVRDNKQKLTQIFWEIEFLKIFMVTMSLMMFLILLMAVQKYRLYFFCQSFQIIAAAVDISWFFMGIENFHVIIFRNILVKSATIILIFTFVKTPSDLAMYIFIVSCSALGGNITLWSYLKKQLEYFLFPKIKNIFKHFQGTVYLFIPQIATQIYLVLNKTMLGSISGVSSAGMFDNADKIIKMILAIVTATGTVMLPRVANTFANGNFKKVKEYLYAGFSFASFLSIPMMFGISAISSGFATWFFGDKFSGIYRLIVLESVVIVLISWNTVIGDQFLLPTKRNRDFSVSVIIGALVNLFANIPLIYFFGTIGATCATVASEICVTGYQIYVIRNEVNLIKLFTDIWKYIVAGIIMYFVVHVVSLTISFNLFTLIFEVIIGTIVYFGCNVIFKVRIFEYAKKLFNRE